MMSGANFAARLSFHNPWTYGNLADLDRGGNSEKKSYAENLLLIFSFNFCSLSFLQKVCNLSGNPLLT